MEPRQVFNVFLKATRQRSIQVSFPAEPEEQEVLPYHTSGLGANKEAQALNRTKKVWAQFEQVAKSTDTQLRQDEAFATKLFDVLLLSHKECRISSTKRKVLNSALRIIGRLSWQHVSDTSRDWFFHFSLLERLLAITRDFQSSSPPFPDVVAEAARSLRATYTETCRLFQMYRQIDSPKLKTDMSALKLGKYT